MLTQIDAVLFDKDGTLFDFAASWSGWTGTVLDGLSGGDDALADAMAQTLGYARATRQFLPHSPVIAGTMAEQVDLLLPHLAGWSAKRLEVYLQDTSTAAQMIPPVPLPPLMDDLRARGFVLGVATNDGEASARMHLTRAGILAQFAEVLGYDSGYTPKPAPDMLLGFAQRTGLDPARVVMVGDSTHDLIAGRRAGMRTVGVLTGMAGPAVLAPHADLVLPDIGHLPAALGARGEGAFPLARIDMRAKVPSFNTVWCQMAATTCTTTSASNSLDPIPWGMRGK
jgi:phosphoglycolate phosphatase